MPLKIACNANPNLPFSIEDITGMFVATSHFYIAVIVVVYFVEIAQQSESRCFVLALLPLFVFVKIAMSF